MDYKISWYFAATLTITSHFYRVNNITKIVMNKETPTQNRTVWTLAALNLNSTNHRPFLWKRVSPLTECPPTWSWLAEILEFKNGLIIRVSFKGSGVEKTFAVFHNSENYYTKKNLAPCMHGLIGLKSWKPVQKLKAPFKMILRANILNWRGQRVFWTSLVYHNHKFRNITFD